MKTKVRETTQQKKLYKRCDRTLSNRQFHTNHSPHDALINLCQKK